MNRVLPLFLIILIFIGFVNSVECNTIINNGDFTEKIDMVFVGEGFETEELENYILEIVGKSSIYHKHSLFNIEPFKSNEELFNIHIINQDSILCTTNDYNQDMFWDTGICDYNKIIESAEDCNPDNVIYITNSEINPHANFKCNGLLEGGCEVISTQFSEIMSVTAEEKMGDIAKSLVHELGHGFGKLADEYSVGSYPPLIYEPIIDDESLNCIEISSSNEEENFEYCRKNAPWKNLIGDGCGEPGVVDCYEEVCSFDDESGTTNCFNESFGMEIDCYRDCGSKETIGDDKITYKPIYANIMNPIRQNEDNNDKFGIFDEILICKQMKKIIGNVGGICNDFDLENLNIKESYTWEDGSVEVDDPIEKDIDSSNELDLEDSNNSEYNGVSNTGEMFDQKYYSNAGSAKGSDEILVNCEGCLVGTTCYEISTRIDKKVCTDQGYIYQKSESKSCEHNYECLNNNCLESICTKQNAFRKIINWFKNLFR
ncbi:MAG: hypothetical protein ABFS35_23835 [Bacteroidota bacterium]